MTSFAAAELRARQRLRERSDAEAPSSSLCARHERLKCSVAALSALRYDDAHTTNFTYKFCLRAAGFVPCETRLTAISGLLLID